MTEGGSLSFAEHLEELRGRLIICIAALTLTTLGSLFFAADALNLLARPLLGAAESPPEQVIRLTFEGGRLATAEVPRALAGQVIDPGTTPLLLEVRPASGEPYTVTYGRDRTSHLYYFGLADPIHLLFKMAFLLGVILAMPVLGWQAWLFIAPGLTARERAVARPLILLFVVAFPLGAAFAYWLLGFAVRVLLNFAFGDLVLLPDVTRYLSFVLTMMMAFGLVFETPGVFWILGQMGVVSAAWMARQRRWAFVLSFTVAAVLTPTPDGFNQAAMAIPLFLLYELSIWLVRWTERARP